jgi:alkylhydroperoxidase family enzyme
MAAPSAWTWAIESLRRRARPTILFSVAAWREAPYFTEAERAALALAEAITRLSDQSDPVREDIWNEATLHYDERALAGLILCIATTNLFNRINATTKQVAGEQPWSGH